MVAPLGSRLPLAAGHKKQLTPETRKPFAFRHSVPCTLIPRGCNLSELPSISIRCIVSTSGRGIGDGSSRHSTACDTCEWMTRNVRERARARCSRVRSCETWRDLPLTRLPAAGHTQHTGYDLINRNNTDVGSSSVCRCSSVWMRLILCGDRNGDAFCYGHAWTTQKKSDHVSSISIVCLQFSRALIDCVEFQINDRFDSCALRDRGVDLECYSSIVPTVSWIWGDFTGLTKKRPKRLL